MPGNSTDTLAKLQAQRGNQELDVVFLDDGPMYQAVSFGFCDTIQDAAIFDDIYDIAKMNTDKAVGVGFVVTGIAYNKDMFAKNGWEAPTSWHDLADPKYQGKLVVPPINNTYGLHALIMTARLNNGNENNIEAGFQAFGDQIASNVLVFEPSSGKMSELFQNGEIALSVWGSGRLKSLADTGFPGGFVYPKEGGVALMVMPGILSGSLIVFALTASAFATPAIIGGRRLKVVATTVYDEYLNTLNWPLGAAITLLLLLANIVIIMSYNRVIERRYAKVFA